jgi:hypothetical protein
MNKRQILPPRSRSAVAKSRTMIASTMFAALAAAIALWLIPHARAAPPIEHCVAADGTPVYTDKPCTLLDARHVPISGELLSRIALEEAAGTTTAEADLDATSRPATPAIARRSAASGCARSATQLSMDLQGAWALRDVNRIAESYHWIGLDHAQGQQILQQLDRLSGQPLLQAQYFNAQIGSGPMQFAGAGEFADANGSGGAGVMQLTLGGGGAQHVRDFNVERYRGCYFIRF